MKIPAWATKLLPPAHYEFNLKVCKDGTVSQVMTKKRSGNTDFDGAVRAELDRLTVPKPSPEVAETMTANCVLFDTFEWSLPAD